MNDYLIVNLMSDFIYLPYTNKESVFVTSKTVKKNDIICEYNNKKVYSPVSGNAYAYSEIPSIDGITKVVIIENDFKDTTSPSYQKESIYDITDKELMEIFPKNERSVKREERYFKQQGNIEFFRRAENADIF